MTTAVGATAGDRHDWRSRRRLGLVVGGVTLAVLCLVSLAVGSKGIPLSDVLEVLRHADGSEAAVIVRDQRIPRTVLAVIVGLALAIAGALMQGLTRNPLADPGLLGVSAGAAFAMAIGTALISGLSLLGGLWFAFAGAVVTTVAVYLIGAAGRAAATPVTLVLAGVALSAVLSGITAWMALLDPTTFTQLTSWQTGDLANRRWDTVVTILPFIGIGLLLALAAAHALNALALGDDLATALGGSIGLTRFVVVVAVTLLCGAATAAVGPILFLGLMVPHVARWIVGPDQRWILGYALLLGPILLLVSDIVGRVVVRPDEVAAGIVTALIGGPVLIWLVRRRQASAL